MTVITGGPGTGKTTVVQTIIRLAEQEGMRILLCAPTGRPPSAWPKRRSARPRPFTACSSPTVVRDGFSL